MAGSEWSSARTARCCGARYETALGSDPDAVGIISWNEFSENSHIEPSCDYGTRALEVLASLRGAVFPTDIGSCPAEAAATTGGGSIAEAPVAPPIVEEPDPPLAAESTDPSLTLDERIRADFDSSSPGGTEAGPRGIGVLGLLVLFILFNLAVIAQRARRRPNPPIEVARAPH